MHNQNGKQEDIFKGLNFDERVQLRRELIAQNGTSLPENEEKTKFSKSKKKESSNPNDGDLDLEDPEIFKNKNFEERLKIRRELISKYGTSLKDNNKENNSIFNKKGDKENTQNIENPEIFKNKNFDERLKIRRELISKYGTSLFNEKKTKKNNSKKKTENASDFESRVTKRRIIAKIEENKNLNKLKKKVILENKIEFINDPDIIIDEEANICYITDKKLKEKVVFKKNPGVSSEIMRGDEYDGSYGGALERARRLHLNARLPVFYVPWSESRGAFRTSLLDRSKSASVFISNRDFYPVKLYIINIFIFEFFIFKEKFDF